MQAQYNMKFLNFAMPTFTSERVKMWLTQIMSSHPVPDVDFLNVAVTTATMTGSRYVMANVTMNTGTELPHRILRRIMRI